MKVADRNDTLLGVLEAKLTELAKEYSLTIEDAYWLEDAYDDQEYCHGCAQKILLEVLPDYEYARVCGGYGGLEMDGPLYCAGEGCGKQLDCTLTDEGIESELEYYRKGGAIMPIDSSEAYHLLRVLQCMDYEQQHKDIKLWKRVAKELMV